MIENKNIRREAKLSEVTIEGESYYKISNSDQLRPFFMSIVSESDHWMFISSNGGLSAGRKNAEYSLFPYYTDDKITESAEITGSKSFFLISIGSENHVWEPFSDQCRSKYKTTRNLYKNLYGNKVLFEEINHDLDLIFKYEWNSSDRFGFVRKSSLINSGKEEIHVSLLDGIQNILPYGVASFTQNNTSNLVDAYKRSELIKEVGLGIFALSAIIVDKAEPSEALKANIAWSVGFENPTYLLSSLQLDYFRQGKEVQEESDVKAEKGAYFLKSSDSLPPGADKEWMIIANVNQTHADIIEIAELLKGNNQLEHLINNDVNKGTQRLIAINASSDALQLTDDQLKDARHFSNTLFNIMRGGIFDNNYQIEKWDFVNYLKKANKTCLPRNEKLIKQLPPTFSHFHMLNVLSETSDSDLKRLGHEYMPLKFSRRHGDPSRPWNRFSINTRDEIDGSKILDYEGNWRDIFQNWEALSLSYPQFVESMIYKFLNSSTFDGYNPYRITKDGFDWEVIEPDDPWSYIGYWGDHQIIYLLKFLEIIENHDPGKLNTYFNREIFVYANVPYIIKKYEDILSNPKDTIEFDEESDDHIRNARSEIGADGALLKNTSGRIYYVNFIEKILATVLAKVSNFIPEGGIWMNTQRPEWNDANNALVGNGVSMVTLYYLRRFLKFFEKLLSGTDDQDIKISTELSEFFNAVLSTLDDHQKMLNNQIDNSLRKKIMDGLGQAGSDYRSRIYNDSFSGSKSFISLDQLKNFISISLQYLEHSIRANKRPDDLYHAYNLMTLENENEVSISHLSEMLEGQVAVLSSGYLTSKAALKVLDGMKDSSLFRPDQYSYLLYPNKDLPRFMEKNNVPKEVVSNSKLLSRMIEDGDLRIIEKNVNGGYHFNGNFRNANDLKAALDSLVDSKYRELVKNDKKSLLEAFENMFNHKAFTGRSGTFFGYEGLGSIYWHMVSKLLLAVQECCLKAIRQNDDEVLSGKLLEHFYEINEGIGVHKPPSLYGAFPTDPYSHTPATKGAQQPGMTGQVKEDILSRFGELGVFVKDGHLLFHPCLLRREEFLTQPAKFNYVNINQQSESIDLGKESLAFTYCQVPIVYHISTEDRIEIIDNQTSVKNLNSLELDRDLSLKIFQRSGKVSRINVFLNSEILK